MGDAASYLLPAVYGQIKFLCENMSCRVSPLVLSNGDVLNDRFTLEIPFCSDRLRWLVVYQRVGLQWVPDFVFNEPDFHPLEERNIASETVKEALAKFNIGQRNHLLVVIRTLLHSYSQYQRDKLREYCQVDARLQWELDTTASRNGVQVAFSKGTDGKPDKVWFVIPLTMVELDPLQPFLKNVWRPLPIAAEPTVEALQESVTLNVVFSLTKAGTLVTAPDLVLNLPQQLETFIGRAIPPPWTNDMCIMEYIPSVIDKVDSLVRKEGESLGIRESFLAALMKVLGRPLELDTIQCRAASFLVTHETNNIFVLCFHLPQQFPKERARIVLQVHVPQPDLVIYSDYPWSPRWSIEEMATRLITFVRDEMYKWRQQI